MYRQNIHADIIYKTIVLLNTDMYYLCKWGWLGKAESYFIGHPTDIGLQLGKARPAVLAADKARGGMFLFLLFLHFHSFHFLPCPSLLSPLLSLLSLFSLSLGDKAK